MKSMRKISSANLNAIVANTKTNKLVDEIRSMRPEFLSTATIPTKVQLRKVVLREQAFGIPAGTPIYAFAKRASKRVILLVDVRTGLARLSPMSSLISSAPVTGKFEIDGVTYKQKDTVNGQPRYSACGSVRKSRAKALNKHKMLNQVHAARQDALDEYWLEEEPGAYVGFDAYWQEEF